MPHSPELATQHGQVPVTHSRWRTKPVLTFVLVTVFGAMLLLALLALLTSRVASEENAMTITPEPQSQPAAADSGQSSTSATQESSGGSSSSVSTSTSASTTVSTDGSMDTNVTVNGEDIPVEPNGSVHRTIQDANGTTTVDVSSTSNGESSNSSSSSLNVNVSTNSSSFSSDSSTTFTMGGATENN